MLSLCNNCSAGGGGVGVVGVGVVMGGRGVCFVQNWESGTDLSGIIGLRDVSSSRLAINRVSSL